MLFQNVTFFLFALVAFALYWRFAPARLWVLAGANAVFYMAAGIENLVLFLVASCLTYRLGHHVTGRHGKWVLGAGVVANLANLAFFKYAHFLTGTLHSVWPVPFLDPQLVAGVLLPIGISFYTFQHISYLVDRRTRGLAEAPSYLQFWVYISFFGHSIAGPIMRGHEFLPQIAETTKKRLEPAAVRYGLYLFMLGLVKKVAIADHLGQHVDAFFGAAQTLSFGEAWAAAFLFAFRIYFDFSAYSDMAVGIGHLFGYTLSQNFRTPYVAANASEFWSRWHITLSAWIRDYVYIPLGGNRLGVPRQMINLMLAMLASGLWHGAAWTFVAWGAFHGALSVAQHGWKALKGRLGWGLFEGRPYRAVATMAFFVLVTWGWVLFRAGSIADATAMMTTMLKVGDWASLGSVKAFFALIALLYAAHWGEYWAREREGALGEAWRRRVPFVIQGAAYAGLVMLLMVVYSGGQDFIYFKF